MVYVIILAGAVAVLGEVYGDLLRAAGATERLMELLDSRSPVASPAPSGAAAAPRTAAAPCAFEAVTLPLSVAARTRRRCATSAWTVAPGETVALVGPSGAGKSTVFQLLLRFYDPQPGPHRARRRADARRWRCDDLRARIGLVPQDAVIFSSQRDGEHPLRPARRERRRGASPPPGRLRRTTSSRALPEGYDTFLGERGVRLSGGQRQRIAIARAMLKNPPLLLLDEATSALDAESERMVQAALESAMRDRTTLVIAHRLATVQQADRIVVLDHGGIVEQGTHESLVARGRGLRAAGGAAVHGLSAATAGRTRQASAATAAFP